MIHKKVDISIQRNISEVIVKLFLVRFFGAFERNVKLW